MKIRKWNGLRFLWHHQYKRIGIVMLLLLSILLYSGVSQDCREEAIAVVQMSALPYTVPEGYISLAKQALVSGGGVHLSDVSLRDAIWRLLVGILPENGICM